MTATTIPTTSVGPDNGTFRSLRNRNFRLFFSGQLISQTGVWLTSIAQTLLVLSLTDSGLVLGLLLGAQFGPVLVLGPWAGAVADRVDKRRWLIRTQSAAMIQALVLGTIVLGGHATLPVVFGLAAIQGTITAFDNPTRRAFVVEMVDEDDLPNAVSLNSAIMTGSRVVGPAIAGALVVALGHGWPFIIGGIAYTAVITGLLRMRSEELHAAPRMPRAPGQVREGLRYIRSQADLLVPLVMMAIIGTVAYNFSVTIPLLVKGTFGGSTQTFTAFFSVLSAGSVVGALRTARRTEVTTHQLAISAAGFGIAMFALAAAPTLALAFPAAFLVGLASITFMTSCTAIVQVLAGPEFRGRVLAIQTMVFLGSTPIGAPLIGSVSDAAGPRVGLLLGGLACLTAAAVGHRALRQPTDGARVDPITTEIEVIGNQGVTLAD